MSVPASEAGNDAGLLQVYGDQEKNENARIKENDKEIGALQESLNQEKAAVKKMPDNIAPPEPSTKKGAKFQLEEEPTPPKLEPDNPKHIAIASFLLFLLGSLAGGGSQYGMVALTGALNGYAEGKKRKSDELMDQWKAETDKVVAHNQMVQQEYTNAWTAAKGNWEVFQGKAAAVANIYHDQIMLQALKDKNHDAVGSLLGAREKALILRNTDIQKVKDNAWNHAVSQVRGRVDALGRQQSTIQEQINHNDTRIGQLQAEQSNAEVFAKNDDERKSISDKYQAQIADLEKQSDGLQKQLADTGAEYGKYQSKLDQMMGMDADEQDAGAEPISADVKAKALDHAKTSKLKPGDTFQVITDSGSVTVKYTGTDIVPVTQ